MPFDGLRAHHGLLANSPVDQLAYHIQVPEMPRILLEKMDQDPAECGRIAGEPATQLRPICQLRLAGNRIRSGGDRFHPLGERDEGVFRLKQPPLRLWIVISPRVRYLLGCEAPLHPAPLNEDQMLQKPEW